MAFLEPHEKIWRGESGKYFTLPEVHSKADTVAPFDGLCGFSPELAEYSGTIFRFPLRNVASDLSDQLYDLDKLKKLFNALKCEGKHLLLFLRSVDTVEVYEIDSHGQQSMRFKTSIANIERDNIYARRKEFLQAVQQEYAANKYSIKRYIPLTLDFTVAVEDEVVTEHHWIVVSQVGSSNQGVLQCASSYQILPWVGAAMETGGSLGEPNAAREGRVFCFLPMPAEASSPLPIHVNGTFGLSDDRRTLKWQSNERQNDTAAEWNKVLVSEVLPPCYALLIRYAIDNLQMPYREIYNMWPDEAIVRGTEWEPLLSSLFAILSKSDRIVWTSLPDCNSSKSLMQEEWISVNKATFVQRMDNLSQLEQVHTSLCGCGVRLVEVPALIHKALELVHCSMNYLTPAFAKQNLKSNHSCYESCYESLVSAKKIEVLKYCLSDNEYKSLIGLKLLPLANDSFVAFQSKDISNQTIYLCSSSYPRELFPNKDNCIVSSHYTNVLQELKKVAASKCTQVQEMDLSLAVKLIKQCFPSQWQQQQQVTASSTDTSFPADWFTIFWKWVQPLDLKHFAEEMIVPLSRDPSLQVTRLSSRSSVLYLTDNDLGQDTHLLSAIHKLPLGVTDTLTHPHFFHGQLDTYVNRLTPGGILDALSNSCNEQFLQLQTATFTMDEAYQLCVLLSQLVQTQLTPPRYKVLLNLPIFSTLNQPSALCNVFASAQASWGKKAMVQPQELPLSAKLLPDSLVIFPPLPQQLPLLRLLSDHVQVPTVMQFILNTLLPMITQGAYKPLSSMDAIMSEMIVQLPTWKWHYQGDIPALLRSLSELPFLPVGDHTCSQRRCPKDLYDPSNSELVALFHGEQVFPCAPFNEQSHLLHLRECGLMTEVSPQALVNTIGLISLPYSEVPQQVDPVRYSRAKAVLGYLNNHPSTNGLQAQLAQMAKSRSWLPVNSTPPDGYPTCLQWTGGIYKTHLASANIFVPTKEMCELPLILGSQMFVANCLVPDSLSHVFNTVSLGPLVVAHFKEVIAHHAEITAACLKKMVHLIYQYLSKQADPKSLLQGLPMWMYINGKFESPQMAAVEANGSFSQDLTPYVHILPESLTSYQDLFTQCGVEMTLTHRQICSVLEMMHSGGGSEVSPERAWNIVVSILNWLTSNGEQMVQLGDGETLYVPIECDSKGPSLEDFTKVTYTDNEFLRNTLFATGQGVPHLFLNHRVASLAHCLHLSPLSDHLSITEDIFEDAGQHEPLTVRLKNILKEYKDGLTIVKEMLQNADDAGATELNICYDARTHATERRALFFPDMEDSHGPALVIHNNSTFTDDDFKNITKLAGATKEGSPLKIGKFGVGFCSVYHITDIPSFISRDYLQIFDPTLRYLKGAVKDFTKPGKKLNLSHPILRSSKQLQPYQGLFGFSSQQSYSGTMFRLPFRSSPSEISSTMYGKHTIDEMVSDLKKCSSELVLFLKHITKITFSFIEADSSAPRYLVEIERATQQCRGTNLVTVTTREDGGSSSSKVWLVSSSEEDISGKQGTGSVACLMEAREGRYEVQRCIGETFCFLPLSKSTGLPVHVSANFAVMTNRRGIWAEDSHTHHSTKESQWNLALLELVVPKAYHCMLETLKGLEQEDKLTSYIFHSLWPLDKDLEQHHPWTTLIAALYRKISSGQLMYSCNTSRWLTVGDSRFIAPSIFAVSSAHADTPLCIVEVIKGLGTPVVDLPLAHRAYLNLGQSTITEQVFLTMFFQHIGLLNNMLKCRNEVLVTLLEVFSVEMGKNTERERTLKSALEGNRCVPCSPCGTTVKKCCELVDPQSLFAAMYDDSDGMFPCIAACESDLARQAMLKLGLHYNSVPWEFIIERAQTISSVYSKDLNKALKRVESILQSIHRNMTLCPGEMVPNEARALSSIPFLPVKKKPGGYPLPWFGDSCSHLLCGRDLVTFGPETATSCNVDLIAGSSVAILQWSINDGCVPSDVCNLLQMKTTPSCANVVAHFKQLIAVVPQLKADAGSSVDQICDVVYSYFDLYLSANSKEVACEICELRTLCCIWTGKKFIYPNMLAKNWALHGPYLFKVPTITVYRQRFVEFLNIQSSFTANDALRALREMSNDFGGEPVSEECQQIIKHIIPLLLEGEIDNMSQPVMLPDQAYIMCDASQLAFNDTPWCKADEGTMLIHNIIPRPLALRLGVKAVRSLVVEQYASLFEYKVDEEAFGQSEPLTRRIQNILQDYPNDETVLKELLQNADDAKANKMYIILDKRTHGNKVFNDSWKELQGPALLVWNSSVFSPKDLEGIQKLGFGGKRSDAETIGQYGIGFNAVYHLTDCPSFVSNGDTMCIFDPHCKYAPGANVVKPGRRFDRLKDGFWEKFPDLKSSYLQDGLQNSPQDLQDELKGGSLFRLPLRHTQDMVRTSKIVPEQPDGSRPLPLDADKMQKLLDKWTPCMKQSMFFLNNITEIKFLVIEADSHQLTVTHHFSTRVDQPDMRRLGEFKEAVQDFTSVSGSEPKTVMYSLSLCEIQYAGMYSLRHTPVKPREKVEKWLIQQGIGDIENETQSWSFIKQMKPRHGIAAPLDMKETLKGQVYCFLPLPIMSNLPVHINGHFALNTARRDLWKSTDPKRTTSDDPRHTWNKNLISAIAASYYKFLSLAYHRTCQYKTYESYDQLKADVATYYRLFPDLTPGVLEGFWHDLAVNTYTQLIQHKRTILAATNNEKHGLLFLPDDENGDSIADETAHVLSVRWCPLQAGSPREQAHFFDPKGSKMASHIKSFQEGPSNAGMAPYLISNPSFTQPQTSQQRHMLQSAVGASNQVDSSLQPILEMTGMVITYAPLSIKNNFSTCGLHLPTISPSTVYDYYKEFHNSRVRTYPCDVEESVFKTVSNFKCFLEYVLTEQRYFVQPSFPEGVALVITADGKVRTFQNTNLTMSSKWSHLFPNSYHRFFHPDLLPLNMAACYFLTACAHQNIRDYYYDQHLHGILTDTLPEELLDVESASNLLREDVLLSFWKCFTEDNVFGSCLDTIVKRWALLPSSSHQLFSTQSPLLPIVRSGDNNDVVMVLEALGMPFLEQWMPYVAHRFCPTMDQYSKVLHNLVTLHRRTAISRISRDSIKILLRYFSHINLKAEPQCVDLIRSLPFFEDVIGNWIELNKRQAYICPQNIELDGMDAWLESSHVVLLDNRGVWREFFQPAAIGVHEIQPEELYIKYIFSNFNKLSEVHRSSHLKYIRDVLCYHKIQYNFVNALKILRCLGPDHSPLRPISDFYDHTQNIFNLSAELFTFLPEYFRSGDAEERKWLEFFRELGLKVCITEGQFEQLVQSIVSGQSSDINSDSNTLVQFLFNNHQQFTTPFLYKVAGMPFVPTRELKHLTWIAPAFNAPHRVQRGQETINMAPLKGAYCGEEPCLIWTVMPVITLPSKCTSENVLATLGVITEPSVIDVVKNVTSISYSPVSNGDLFDRESQDNMTPQGGNILITVMSAVFSFLKMKSTSNQADPHINSLCNLACIPVHSQVQKDTVLVKPSQVVIIGDVHCYYPFLHRLPDRLHGADFDDIFKNIGLERTIGPGHMRTFLEMAYNQSDQLPLDINTLRAVHHSLKTLYTMLKKTRKGSTHNLCPLYLPDQSDKLCPSTSLVYCDNVQYSQKNPEFSRAGLSMFLLPPHLGVQEEEFCSLLPEAVRPQCISRCITKVRHMELLPVATPLVDQLQHTLQMPELIEAIVKIVENLTRNSDLTEDLSRGLSDALSNIRVIAVQNLSHSISLIQPLQSIGRIDMLYELTEESEQCQLYIDSNRGSMVTCKLVCDALSDLVMKRLNKPLIYNVLLKLKEYISTLLMVQRLEDIHEVLRTLNIRLGTGEASFHGLEPKLGDLIPQTWHCRLAQDPSYIFRPEEWVGYKTEDGNIIFAQVVESVEITTCSICITEDSLTRKRMVSSRLLYKFRRGMTHPDVTPMTTELVLTQQQTLTIQEAMQQVHLELQRTSQLPVSSRTRSFRQLRREWHPDKHINKPLAEDVYKYLDQQISRLERGLTLEDPPSAEQQRAGQSTSHSRS